MVISVEGVDCEAVGRQLAKKLKAPHYHITCISDFPAENDETHDLWRKSGRLCVVSGAYADVLAGTVIRLYLYDSSARTQNRGAASGRGAPPNISWFDLCINRESLDIPGAAEMANQFVALKFMRRHPARKRSHAETGENRTSDWNGFGFLSLETPL